MKWSGSGAGSETIRSTSTQIRVSNQLACRPTVNTTPVEQLQQTHREREKEKCRKREIHTHPHMYTQRGRTCDIRTHKCIERGNIISLSHTHTFSQHTNHTHSHTSHNTQRGIGDSQLWAREWLDESYAWRHDGGEVSSRRKREMLVKNT